MREFNPALVAYRNLESLLGKMPKEKKPKSSGLLSPNFTTNKPSSNESNEPLFRVLKHIEILREREEKDA